MFYTTDDHSLHPSIMIAQKITSHQTRRRWLVGEGVDRRGDRGGGHGRGRGAGCTKSKKSD